MHSLARLRSAVAYEGPIELAIQRFKYRGWRRLAGPLALLLAERLVVERGKHPAGTEFDVHNFMHFAWGTCDRVVA